MSLISMMDKAVTAVERDRSGEGRPGDEGGPEGEIRVQGSMAGESLDSSSSSGSDSDEASSSEEEVELGDGGKVSKSGSRATEKTIKVEVAPTLDPVLSGPPPLVVAVPPAVLENRDKSFGIAYEVRQRILPA